MSFLQIVVFLIAPCCVSTCAFLLSRKCLHFFQLESYQFRGYFHTIFRQFNTVFLRFVYLAAAAAVLFIVSLSKYPVLILILSTAFVPAGIIVYRSDKKNKEKKPLRFTSRVKRLCAFYAVVLLALHISCAFIIHDIWGSAILAALTPVLLALAAALVLPVERIIYEYYFQSARKLLLRDPRLIRIGITGSFGKTSNKFILETLLKEKYSVLMTPGSFNTPMGLCRVIRERLQPAHQVFIAEMGARHRGDIKELCRLVRPQIGMLTAVGAQHLDTFKTIDRIAETKYDLIRALPKDGFAVFINDESRVYQLYSKTEIPSYISGREGNDAWADHIRCDEKGSHFDLHFKDEDSVLPCTTRLLGRMNIDNIAACALLAKRLGMTNEQIKRGISRITPVEHRMNLISHGDYTVIDDAFNSNPVSSARALDTLSLFSGRKIIVTPGMVELGKEQERYNKEFGIKMAACIDEALLVGEQNAAVIRNGLLESGFSENRIHTFKNLEEAVQFLNTIIQAGDVVLYENDLPDNYS